jgi:type II restriction enzyme
MTVSKYGFENVKNLYVEMEKIKGGEAYKFVSDVLEKAKQPYIKDFLRRKPGGKADQSWRNFKWNCFEKLLQYIITQSVEPLALKVVNDNELKKKKLPDQLDAVKRNVVIDFGEYGMHLPDADIIVYNPVNHRVIAIISSKTSLRERVAQTGYWKFKFCQDRNTRHIKIYLITPDADNTLTKINTIAKNGQIKQRRVIFTIQHSEMSITHRGFTGFPYSRAVSEDAASLPVSPQKWNGS